MKRLQRDAVLVSLIQNLKQRGSWCGETHVQKTAFFLQELTSVPLGFEFILYKHGPYSFDLSAAVMQMRADAIVRIVPTYPYGASLELDDGGSQLLSNFPKTTKRYENQVGFVAYRLATKTVAELERVSTALFIRLQHGDEQSGSFCARELHKIKPHIPIDKARVAVKECDEIRTAATTELVA